MKKLLFCLILLLFSTGCQKNEDSKEEAAYMKISAKEAKNMMDKDEVIVLDVRTEEEYSEGHIEDALLIPVDELEDRAEEELTDKDAVILVYCRSGRRSKTASDTLLELGYTKVYDFGGIIDWKYDVVK